MSGCYSSKKILLCSKFFNLFTHSLFLSSLHLCLGIRYHVYWYFLFHIYIITFNILESCFGIDNMCHFWYFQMEILSWGGRGERNREILGIEHSPSLLLMASSPIQKHFHCLDLLQLIAKNCFLSHLSSEGREWMSVCSVCVPSLHPGFQSRLREDTAICAMMC